MWVGRAGRPQVRRGGASPGACGVPARRRAACARAASARTRARARTRSRRQIKLMDHSAMYTASTEGLQLPPLALRRGSSTRAAVLLACCKTEHAKLPLSVVHRAREPDLRAAHGAACRHRVAQITCSEIIPWTEGTASVRRANAWRWRPCTFCIPPPGRAARQPSSQGGHRPAAGRQAGRRGWRDVARRVSAPRAGILRALALRGGAAALDLRGRAEHRPPRGGRRKVRGHAAARAIGRHSQPAWRRP